MSSYLETIEILYSANTFHINPILQSNPILGLECRSNKSCARTFHARFRQTFGSKQSELRP
jgi:hypothetical protein